MSFDLDKCIARLMQKELLDAVALREICAKTRGARVLSVASLTPARAFDARCAIRAREERSRGQSRTSCMSRARSPSAATSTGSSTTCSRSSRSAATRPTRPISSWAIVSPCIAVGADARRRRSRAIQRRGDAPMASSLADADRPSRCSCSSLHVAFADRQAASSCAILIESKCASGRCAALTDSSSAGITKAERSRRPTASTPNVRPARLWLD